MTMQVPGHVVSMYVATSGKNGPDLGSDEKEIILLVYVVMEAATGQIVGVKQYLVKPTGRPGLERSLSQQSQNNNAQNSNSTTTSVSTGTTTITNSIESTANLVNHNNNNNNNSSTNNNNNNNNNNNTVNNNNTNNNSNLSLSNNNNTPLDIQQQQQSQQQQQTQQNNTVVATVPNPELPIALAQAAGKPLNEAIEQFDEYIRSLSIDPYSTTNFKLITDGQLPLRQCLHPEVSAKDIEIPSYYCKFSDLRKEFVRHKSADLSRALVPVKDVKKLPHMPPLPPLPLSIADMMKELDLTSLDDSEFYVRESRDMVTVIQSLIAAGHKFEANEMINLILEPGICSIDDEIDGSCIVRARGLPWQSSDQDIAKFFRGLNVAKGGVALCLSPLGRRNGEALIRFVSQEHRDMALKRHKHHITSRYIEVYRASGEDFLAVAGGASNEAQAFLSKGAQVIIRMRGLPYDCTAKQVLDFFRNGDNPCDVLDGVDGVLFVKKPDGKATGDAFVLFAKDEDAPHALSRHRESIGQRYIELFRSTTAEVQQVLNRSMDPKTYEPNPPPLIAQLPPVHQVPLLPQRVITSGTKKNCIRLRGLPYEAQVEHILHFLDDFAKNIIYQGVHMVFNSQGQPSGEAFIQMDSEESARVCALQKHNQFMIFGKKYRYIEVFQCSGDDMNLVLNGGLQSPVASSKPALLSPGMLPQIQQQAPQQSVVTHPHHHLTHHPPPPPSQNVQHSLLPHHSAAAVAVSNALAAAASQHTHFSNAAAAANISHYALSSHPIVAAGQPQSNATSVSAAAAAAAAAHAHAHAHGQVAPAPQSLLSPQFALHAAQNLGPGAATNQPPPQLSLTIPPPTNPALLAQQQAQFIAQHNLLARQNAAAAAAYAQNESFLNIPNMALMQAHANAAGVHAGGHPGAAAYGLHPSHHGGPTVGAPGVQSPYFFMPTRQFFPIAPSFGLMPTPHGLHALQQLGAAQMQSPSSTSTSGNSGGTIVAPPFGFPHYGHAATIFQSPHQRTHPAGPTFYQPQLFYWPYPSPPVSPTAYYAAPATAATPTPSHHHVTSNLVHQNHHQALFPVDFIPASSAAFHHPNHPVVTHHHHQQHDHQQHHHQRHNNHYSPNQHHQHQNHNLHQSQAAVSPSIPPQAQLAPQSPQLQLQTATVLNPSTSSGSKQFSDNKSTTISKASNLGNNSNNHTVQPPFHPITMAVVPSAAKSANSISATQVQLGTPILNGNVLASPQPHSPPVPAVLAGAAASSITNGTSSAAYMQQVATASTTGTPIAASHILSIDTSNTTNMGTTALSLEKFTGSHLHSQRPLPGQLAPAQLTGRILSPAYLTATNYHHQHIGATAAGVPVSAPAFGTANHYVELYIA